DLGVDLAAGKNTTVSGFRALRQLHLDTLHRRQRGLLRELVRIEPAVVRAATEVPGTELPHEVTTVPQVVVGNRALSRVVREPALGGTTVECEHRLCGQRAETHRGDVQQTHLVRLGALRAADAGL